MELDDLRRQWQQAPAAAAPVLPDIGLLLKQQSTSLIERMRRSVWMEILASALLTLLPLPFIQATAFLWWYVGAMTLLASVLGYCYARQLALLSRMAQAEVSIRGHLQVLCAGLRQLLRFYYYLTLWLGPSTYVLMLGYGVSRELSRAAGPRWQQLGILMSLALVLGVIFQVGIVYFNRWYLQRLYGQHLDRLEGQLRELDDVPAG